MADQSRQIKLAAAKKKVKYFTTDPAYHHGKHWSRLSPAGFVLPVFFFLVWFLLIHVFTEQGCCHYTSPDLCAAACPAAPAPVPARMRRRDRCFLWAFIDTINFPRLCRLFFCFSSQRHLQLATPSSWSVINLTYSRLCPTV